MNGKWMRAALAAGVLAIAGAAQAADKTYQVTGPVVDVTDSAITVQKGKENWTIAKGTAQGLENVKKGDKVTVEYTMTAKSVEVKGGAKAASKKAAGAK
jgi:RNase P/RNase MRP subunit p29